jgi:hypothetical protein
MLRFWKKRLLTLFIEWLKNKHKLIRKIDKEYQRCLEKRKGRWVFVELGETATSEEKSKVGLAGYRNWRKARVTAGTRYLEAGSEAIERASRASWWNWEDGSRPFHWRWPEEYQERIRDGIEVHFQHDPPTIALLKETQRILNI